MAEVTACFGHTPYGSQHLAANAAALHHAGFPHCAGVHPWACGDHWHVGHHTAGDGQRCKGNPDHRAAQQRVRQASKFWRRS